MPAVLSEKRLFGKTGACGWKQASWGKSRTTTLGPFGEVIRATGPMAKVNPFMFSTKYYDWETGLYYYGHDIIDHSTGRWLIQRPIGDRGFELLPTGRSPVQNNHLLSFNLRSSVFNRQIQGLGLGGICSKNTHCPSAWVVSHIRKVGISMPLRGNNPLSFIDSFGLMTVENAQGNVTITSCPKCPFCLAHWLGLSDQGMWFFDRDHPDWQFMTCDWKLGEGHVTVVIGPGGSATVDGQDITVPTAKHGAGTVIISDCDRQADIGVNGIRG